MIFSFNVNYSNNRYLPSQSSAAALEKKTPILGKFYFCNLDLVNFTRAVVVNITYQPLIMDNNTPGIKGREGESVYVWEREKEMPKLENESKTFYRQFTCFGDFWIEQT